MAESVKWGSTEQLLQSFYLEGFIIQCEGLDEATGEKEYTIYKRTKRKIQCNLFLYE